MIDNDIAVSAVVFRHAAGDVLTVRKRGTSSFMLPGGKFDGSESAVDTAIREIREELQLELDPSRLTPLGTFSASSANEPERRVIATVFEYHGRAAPRSAAEIEELKWVDPQGAHQNIAPLLTEEVFPLLTRAADRTRR